MTTKESKWFSKQVTREIMLQTFEDRVNETMKTLNEEQRILLLYKSAGIFAGIYQGYSTVKYVDMFGYLIGSAIVEFNKIVAKIKEAFNYES